MLDLRSLEVVVKGLENGTQFDKEVLKNIAENCYCEIISLTSEDIENRRPYVEMVCKGYGLSEKALAAF